MKHAHAAPGPERDGRVEVDGRCTLEEALVATASEGLVIGLGLRVAELRHMNLELRDALAALHERYERLCELPHLLGDDVRAILSSATSTLRSAPALDPAAGEAFERIRQAAERMARRLDAPANLP